MSSHICQIINTLGAGGAEQYVVQLSNYLASSGHQVSIIAGEPQVLRYRLASGIHVETLQLHPGERRSPISYLINLWRSCRYLVSYFRKENVTIIHTHLAASALPAWIAAKICKIPVIHSKMYSGNSGSKFEKTLFSSRIPQLLVARFLAFTRYSKNEIEQH
ncbi:glycosyltransferase [Paucibacter sp. TC2R-5]|uniref:glycosyltransferase n=1 Tax=Paucibacter sp. TC2R-5 TaxID=2893555 RepID=UPI0021E4A99C|nr:glycosyltransferase [Paucibacter sp. TC2R-5]MCV2361779.1 glycosyltransferase [Paucibacter sp. TC2R-5]